MKRDFVNAFVVAAALLVLPLPARSADKDSPWEWDASITLDALRSLRPRGHFGLMHLDAGATVDAEKLFGWTGVKLGAEAMVDMGSKPNGVVASLQGVNNIEVTQSAARLYTLWAEGDMAPGWRLRVGLHDLNSEFYVTDASDQLTHPVFGIGAELAPNWRRQGSTARRFSRTRLSEFGSRRSRTQGTTRNLLCLTAFRAFRAFRAIRTIPGARWCD